MIKSRDLFREFEANGEIIHDNEFADRRLLSDIGAFGTVYSANCRGVPVAVKVLKKQDTNDERMLVGLRNEIRTLKALVNQFTVLYLGVCTDPGCLSIVTELCEGGDVATYMGVYMDRHGGVPPPIFDRLRWARDAARGMSWLHSRPSPVFHRDLKLENLLLTRNGDICKVADFGLSVALGATGTLRDPGSRPPGSPLYMAPEVLLRQQFSCQADVYSFGLVLWELMAVPDRAYADFRGPTATFDGLVQRVGRGGHRPDLSRFTSRHSFLCQLIERCWHPDPDYRYVFTDVADKLSTVMLCEAIGDEAATLEWMRQVARTPDVTITPNQAFSALRMQCGARGTEAPLAEWDRRLLDAFYRVNAEVGSKNSSDGVTPAVWGDLARYYGPFRERHACTSDRHVCPLHRMLCVNELQYFHGAISEEVATSSLSQLPRGTFLLRYSSQAGAFSLSFTQENGRVCHRRITPQYVQDDAVYRITRESGEFRTIPDLLYSLRGSLQIRVALPLKGGPSGYDE